MVRTSPLIYSTICKISCKHCVNLWLGGCPIDLKVRIFVTLRKQSPSHINFSFLFLENTWIHNTEFVTSQQGFSRLLVFNTLQSTVGIRCTLMWLHRCCSCALSRLQIKRSRSDCVPGLGLVFGGRQDVSSRSYKLAYVAWNWSSGEGRTNWSYRKTLLISTYIFLGLATVQVLIFRDRTYFQGVW